MLNVTIVITPKGYITTLNIGGEPIVSEWIVTNFGGKALDKGFEDNKEVPDFLYEALEDNDLLDIAKALGDLSDMTDRGVKEDERSYSKFTD